jgi:hypothetical protein
LWFASLTPSPVWPIPFYWRQYLCQKFLIADLESQNATFVYAASPFYSFLSIFLFSPFLLSFWLPELLKSASISSASPTIGEVGLS